MRPAKLSGGVFSTGAAFMVMLAACNPPSGLIGNVQASPQVAASNPASTPAPTPTPKKSATPSPATSTSSSGSTGDLLAKGKLVFEVTAGGVGCASCHGMDGGGKTAPYIRGATESMIRNALSGGVPAMSDFIVLTDEEITAVAAYLELLAANNGTQALDSADHDEHDHH